MPGNTPSRAPVVVSGERPSSASRTSRRRIAMIPASSTTSAPGSSSATGSRFAARSVRLPAAAPRGGRVDRPMVHQGQEERPERAASGVEGLRGPPEGQEGVVNHVLRQDLLAGQPIRQAVGRAANTGGTARRRRRRSPEERRRWSSRSSRPSSSMGHPPVASMPAGYHRAMPSSCIRAPRCHLCDAAQGRHEAERAALAVRVRGGRCRGRRPPRAASTASGSRSSTIDGRRAVRDRGRPRGARWPSFAAAEGAPGLACGLRTASEG